MQGDRVGICLTQLDAKVMERGLGVAGGQVECLEREVASAREVERVLEHRLKEVRPFARRCWFGTKVVVCVYTSGCII